MGKFHVRILLKDVSRFAENQEKTTFDLGFKIEIT